MGESITIPLQELITSGCLSKSTLLFNHEVTMPGISGPNNTETNKDRLRHLNAAKISLLLAKSSGSINISEHILSSPVHSRSIILVQVKRCTEETDTALKISRSSSDSSFDKALDDFFSGDGDEAKQETGVPCKTVNRFSHNSLGTASAASDRGSVITEKACFAEGRIRTPISDVCTLIDVRIISDQSNGPMAQSIQHYDTPISTNVGISPALKILGNLIYSVFSPQCEQSLSAMYQNLTAPEVDDANIAINPSLPRHSKQRRNISKTLFSSLVESGQYPTSICRLLSDMIDVGQFGKADTPFASIDEVIHDLEQMTLYPDIFLHDSYNGFNPSPGLLFGQGHYGRTAEVAKLLEISTHLEQSAGCDDGFAETVFISGIAGSGKTHLYRRVGSFLSSLGWIVLEAKFDRCREYQSSEVICTLLDKLICKLIDMKLGSNEKDIEYSKHAATSISGSFDASGLSDMADLVPRIRNFIDGIDRAMDKKEYQSGGTDSSFHWRAIFLVSTLLGAILRLDRFIMICIDDLQWCDIMMLTLIEETIVSVAQHRKEKQHLLFVGTYRDNEIDSEHPLTNKLIKLKENKRVNVTELTLSCLSIVDVSDMLMTEMRLPRRLVLDLARAVQKKTSGHAIFVVELLNSLLRDSTIEYSPQKRRLYWNSDQILSVKTGDDVASLIISKLSSLQPGILWTLCVLSCFGMKTETSLLRLLQGSPLVPEGGFDLLSPAEAGFIQLSGSVSVFAHDLIQQHVYEKMHAHERQKLHLEIGTFLATKTTLDSSPTCNPTIEAGMEQLFICDGDDEQDDDSSISILSLAGIATSQVNKAGLELISDRTQRIRFAGWNLHAANDCALTSNFRGVIYYCKNGISFLGANPWLNDTCWLSLELHERVAFALFAVGKVKEGGKYANTIIDAENVEFEQSLAAQNILLRSLDTLGADTVARGLAVLRRLNFDIPAAPTPAIVLHAMEQTSNIASQYNFGNIYNLTQVHPKQKNILKITESVAVACFLSTSPYLPLVVCATVTYSLQHGIFHCEEAASAFSIFGYFRVLLQNKFDEGKRWGDLAITIIGNSSHGSSSARARMYLFGFLYFWFIPITESCRRLHEAYTLGMRCGDVESSIIALGIDWRFQFFGGEKLAIVNANYIENMKVIIKFSKELAKFLVMRKININELMGISDEDPFSVFEGAISNEASLLVDSKLKNNAQLIEAIHLSHFLSAFWMGDFTKAMESSKLVSSLESSKMLKFQTIFFTFYRGIVSYRLFREGNGQHLLTEGNEVLIKLQAWSQACNWVENKVLLLQAEHLGSCCERELSIEKYKASISSARDNGFIHEQALAYECMGHYLSSIVEIKEATACFKQAYQCYLQWGATAKAKQIQKDHHFDIIDGEIGQYSLKRDRDIN